MDEPPLVEAYAAYMTQQVFDPIGMPSAVLTDEPCQLSGNFAESYSYGLAPTLGNPQTLQEPVGVVHLGALGPAGGFWVNVDDMARYLLTQLSGGLTPDGARIVSNASLAETWAPGVAVAPNPPGAELYHYLPYEQAHYGMGWITTTYRDIPIRHHGGGIGGYRTMIGVLPELDAGLVLFTNGGGYGVTDGGLLLHFAELMYGLEPQALGDTHRRYEQEVRSLLTPVLGSFDGGWRLLLRDGRLWLIGADSEHQLWVDAATPGVSITASSASLTGTLTLQDEGGLVVLTFGDGTRVRRLGP